MDISTIKSKKDGTTLEISGDLVASSVNDLLVAANSLTTEKKIILNMAGVPFIDSNGVRTCMQLQNNLRSRGGELCCCNLVPKVRKVFRVTGADKKILLLDNNN